jgi:hypothetical protein
LVSTISAATWPKACGCRADGETPGAVRQNRFRKERRRATIGWHAN